MSQTKSQKIILMVLGVIFTGVVAFYIWQRQNTFSDLVDGQKSTPQTVMLQANINTFQESKVRDNAAAKAVPGGDNYHCSNVLYGYDSKYAYAWVFCGGHKVNSDGELELSSGYSVPTRLEYTQPNFKIVDSKQPGDGSLYEPGLRELFPKQYYDKALYRIPTAEIANLEKEVKAKADAK